ncbi:DUF6268 family outer membrane beta-barrel protein [Arcticibacter sp.]|uniref:DUF6268 family outer membrane beta-barrel protein n=1 Tax=Arcticibacter sp. TaxID=1872630 RepID=UPI00388D140C
MNSKTAIFATFATLLALRGTAQQISFKTEYMGKSGYYYLPPGEKPREKIGDRKGSAMVYQGAVSIPLSLKTNEDNRPTAWGIGFGGAYASLRNQNFSEPMVSEIMNLQLGVYHMRPLNYRWSVRASIGMGVFTPSAKFSSISFKNVLASGSFVFIRHLKPNLDIGGGLAINSSLGYPMAFPAVYLRWKTSGKLDVNIELVEGLDMSAGYNLSDHMKLSYALEMNGQVALLEKDGKDMIFSHQYIVTGFRPEVRLQQTRLTLTGMVGLNLFRPAAYSERTLKGVFAGDNDYHFSASAYASIGLKMNF